jgi:hypothetical protein
MFINLFPIITIVLPNVYILRTQTMKPNIGYTIIAINYQTILSQLVTPIVLGKISMLPTSTSLIWYNVIPPFVPLDPNLHPTYPIGTKELDFSIFRNYTSYVPRNVYLVPKQLVVPPTCIPYFVGNQFPTMVQLVINRDTQPIIAPIPIIVHVTTSLPTYVPRGSIHQQLGDSLGRSSPRGDMLGGPPLIHMLDLLDGHHLTHTCLYHHGINHLLCNVYQNQ